MTCYKIVSTRSEGTLELKSGVLLDRYELSDEELSAVEAELQKWQIHCFYRFLCVADSDNGIDQEEESESILDLKAQFAVVSDNGAVGYCIENTDDAMYFADYDPKDPPKLRCVEESWAGGWGDITKTRVYTLQTRQ